MSATAAEGIRRLGFRRWYERQLIEGHAWFVTCFLCMIVVAVCVEQIDWRHPLREIASVGYITGGVLLGMVSLRRYSQLLMRAETLVGQSTCARCSTYGVLQVLEASSGGDAEGFTDEGWIRVKCRKCSHEWLMEE